MILIICTTNRKSSKSYQVALYYQALFADNATEVEICSLENLPQDFAFSALYENNGQHPIFNQYIATIATAQKILFIVPEYNGSFPGVLKTFIDGLGWPNELNGKKAALTGISDGVLGGAFALSHLTDILNYLGCNVFSTLVRIPFMKKNFIDGQIQDNFITKLTDVQVKGFINF